MNGFVIHDTFIFESHKKNVNNAYMDNYTVVNYSSIICSFLIRNLVFSVVS